jgi:exodeoxyribonuclease-5
VEGEWLVGTETWYYDGVQRLTNSEEVRVKKAQVETFEADDQSEWTVWELKIRTPGRGLTRTIHVLHEEERERYENALERRRGKAEDDPSKWDRFFELRERFARVDYAYATTVHRAQGSTYDTVFVDHRDTWPSRARPGGLHCWCERPAHGRGAPCGKVNHR